MNFLATAGVNFITPTGVRFTKRSKHYLCPAYENDCAFVEITGWLPNNRKKDWKKFRSHYDKALLNLTRHLRQEVDGIRFHKGKFNIYVDATLRADYPMYDTWVNNFYLFNASGVFDCPNVNKWRLSLSNPNRSMTTSGNLMDQLKAN